MPEEKRERGTGKLAEEKTLAEVLRRRAVHQANDLACVHLAGGRNHEIRITYAELDARARRVGAFLQQHGAIGRPILLVYPPGTDFLVGFLGCLYAGAVATPTYPPDPKRIARTLPRFQAIVSDSGAAMVLTTRALKGMAPALFQAAPELERLDWAAADGLPGGIENDWRDPGVGGDSLALLQYTSGSTGTPKGVMVTHRNLVLNFEVLTRKFGTPEGSVALTWLPNYHDMGLIDGLLRPLYAGQTCVFMSPIAFLKQPSRWLEAITTWRPIVSGGPNFAYDLCVKQVTGDQLARLDLSSWAIAYNGAEPVRAETLERFARVFGPAGFRAGAAWPCYGLAEATLFVSGGEKGEPPKLFTVSKDALSRNEAVPVPQGSPGGITLVGCGTPEVERLVIADPETLEPCPPGRVGEVWMSGPSIAVGYWKRPGATEETFRARLANGDGPFMRSGDLGFLREDGELFITGRLKDLIVIRGRNHYPQDIERTVETAAPGAIRQGCGAAFSVDIDGEERLVLVHELERRYADAVFEGKDRRREDPEVDAFTSRQNAPPSPEEIVKKIRRAVAEHHDLQLHAVALIRAGTVPKTSSGKIRRKACRAAFLGGRLEPLHAWRVPETHRTEKKVEDAGATVPRLRPGKATGEISTWLIRRLEERLRLPAGTVDPEEPFANYGLDSKEAVLLTGDLEAWLNVDLPATVMYDYPTVSRLAGFLAEHAPGATGVRAATSPSGRELGADKEPIAVIGIGCRFPGADGPEAFWRLLEEGRDATREVPRDRWKLEDYYDPDPSAPGKAVTARGGFLDRVDEFDPLLFSISPREAERMDPQQRLLLEVAYEALEDAGLRPMELMGSRTGVFVGITNSDYSRILFSDRSRIDAYFGTGSAFSIAANRLSYTFDLRGPSMAVDTACSSSLVAVHEAVKSLRSGESTLAIAGGVNVILTPDITINFSKAGVMAPDGRCKTFDAAADGYGRAEGAGVVVLKPLSRALEDGDPVYAVLLASATNNDGKTNGLMAPNGLAQAEVLREAYRRAGVSPGQVHYIETHGTGTALGDPIEVQALGSVVAEGRPSDRPCAIGAVKSLVGHLEAAAGIAGLIKVVLALKHRRIPPSRKLGKPNPRIPFDTLPVKVQQALEAWPAPPGEALAGVSSFGFGGTNVHVVVKEAPPARAERTPDRPRRRAHLLTLSAVTPAALRDAAARFSRFVAASGAAYDLGDICYTAALRRDARPHRLSLVAESHKEAADKLRRFVAGDGGPDVFQAASLPAQGRRVVFLCPGQGPQWWGMGRELMAAEPVFRASMEAVDVHLLRLAGWSVRDALRAGRDASRIHETEVTQPALFAIQVSLAALWRSWGIHPDVVIGHSMGEVAAAHIAGCIDLETAVRIIYHRGQVMQLVTGKGAMAAVALPLEDALDALRGFEDRLSVAANNGPSSCTISGDPDALATLLGRLEARGVFHRRLKVDLAGHSPQMDPLMGRLEAAIGDVRTHEPEVPIVSTVTGEEAGRDTFQAAYWSRNLREPVLFHTVLERLGSRGHLVFLELSPHPTLLNAVQEAVTGAGGACHVLPSIKREGPEHKTILQSLGALHCLGLPVEFRPLFPDSARCVSLPPYPWQRKRYWIDAPVAQEQETRVQRRREGHPFLATHVELASRPGRHCWVSTLSLEEVPFIADHKVQGVVVFPATAYLEMIHAAVAEAFGDRHAVLSDVRFDKAMFLTSGAPRKVQLEMGAAQDRHRFAFEIFSRPESADEAPWVRHVEGKVAIGRARSGARPARSPGSGDIHHQTVSIAALQQAFEQSRTSESHYRHCEARGIQYGPAFQGVTVLWSRPGEALGRIVLPESVAEQAGAFHLHPALLDACLQVIAAMLPDAETDRDSFLPVRLKEMRVLRQPPRAIWSHAVAVSHESEPGGVPAVPDHLEADVRLIDEDGRVLVAFDGFRIRRLSHEGIAAPVRADWLYDSVWVPRPHLAPLSVAADGDRSLAGQAWLVLAGATGVGRLLCEQVRRAGAVCWEVRAGEGAGRAGDDGWVVGADEAGDLGRLVERLEAAAGRPFDRIVDLWPLDAPAVDSGSPRDIQVLQVDQCGRLVELVRAVGGARDEAVAGAGRAGSRVGERGAEKAVVWVVTRGAQPVGGSAVDPRGACLWGLGRGIAQEVPETWGGLIDLDPDWDAVTASAALMAELAGMPRDDEVAYRGGRRMVRRLVRREDAGVCLAPSMRQDGTYLVTGGLGSLGLKLARWLAERGAGHLVLTSRSGPETRTEWEVSAALGLEPAATLARIEAQGTRVTVARVDVSDGEAMSALLERVEREGPSLRGVIHAAGVVSTVACAELGREDLEKVLAPKVQGAWVLHRATQERNLDFFVLFSSAAATWGSRLLAHYAAANQFLDALAHYRRGLGLPALSVDWAMWGDSGMASQSDNARMLRNMGLDPMAPEEALRLLEQLMAVNAIQATVAAVDWQVFKPMYEQQPRRRLLEDLVVDAPEAEQERAADSGAAVSAAVRLSAVSDPAQRLEEAKALLAGFAANALGLSLEDLDRGAPLTTQGMDSLTASELRNRIQAETGVRINVVHLLRGDSVDALAAEVVAGLPGVRPEAAPSGGEGDGAGTARGAEAPARDPSRGIVSERGQAGRDQERTAVALVGRCNAGRSGLSGVGEPASLVDAAREVRELVDETVDPSRGASWDGAAPKSVLLTGAAGFLGGPLLAELCRGPGVRVTCLVRASSEAEAFARVRANLEASGRWDPSFETRVRAIPGDLSVPGLGVAPERWEDLAEETDLIVHAGFLVNFLFSYQDLRPTNVLGTRELLRLACTGRVKPMHFVSSFSVFLTSEYAGKTVREDDMPCAGPGGYRETKRVCEAMVLEAGARGLPVAIHRPPFIGWDTRTGVYNTRDFLVQFLLGCLELGVAPDVSPLFHIAPVDVVARAIAALAADPHSPGKAYHIIGDERGTVWAELVELLNAAGARLDMVPYAAWRERVRGAPGNPLQQFFPANSSGGGDRGAAVLALFDRASMPARIVADNTREALGDLGCPEMDPSLVKVFLGRVRAGGTIDPGSRASSMAVAAGGSPAAGDEDALPGEGRRRGAA